MPPPLFTREQIFEIRARFDAGESGASIARDFHRASLETLRRIGRRETYREVGVGATERPLVSNRLAGEARQAGSPAPTAPAPQPPDFGDLPPLEDLPEPSSEVLAAAARLAREIASGGSDPVGKFLATRKENP